MVNDGKDRPRNTRRKDGSGLGGVVEFEILYLKSMLYFYFGGLNRVCHFLIILRSFLSLYHFNT